VETSGKGAGFAWFLGGFPKNQGMCLFGYREINWLIRGAFMDATQLRQWRKMLGLTQGEAAEKLGVGRTAFQNWELGYFPVPLAAQLACESILKEWKQRPEFGPVTLIYTDRPIRPGPECNPETRVLHCEFHDNIGAAIARTRALATETILYNPAILDPEGDVLWASPVLLRECNAGNKDHPKNHEMAADGVKPNRWWEVLYGNKTVTGPQIRAARALLGWSQPQLVRASGVSLSSVVQIESIGTNVQSKIGSKLRHALELAGIEFLDEPGKEGVQLRPR
jgi:transcriptional regulator with XRE-family HTH domain